MDWLTIAAVVVGALLITAGLMLVARRISTGRFLGPVPAKDTTDTKASE